MTLPINPTLPTAGQDPWDVDLNAVLTAIIAEVNANPGGIYAYPVPTSGHTIGPSWLTNEVGTVNPLSTTFQGVVPFVIGKQISMDQMAIQVDTADGSATVGMAMWASNTNGLPATRVAQATATPSATGILAATITPVVLAPGIYWGGVAASSTATLRVRAVNYSFYYSPSNNYTALPKTNGRTWQLDSGGAYNAPSSSISSYGSSFADYTAWMGIRRSA